MKKLTYLIIALSLVSCSEFLDTRPNKDIVTPNTLEDIRAILDNTSAMNTTVGLNVISSDDYITDMPGWLGLGTNGERNSYIWQEEIIEGLLNFNDWNNAYRAIFMTNLVFEELSEIKYQEGSSQAQFDILKGEALFFRSFYFLQLLEMFATQFDPETADVDLGIPLKLTTDIYEKTPRSSVSECYNLIFDNLHEAISLLEDSPAYLTRPSRCAAKALLSRVYLITGDYENAAQLADELIDGGLELLDYNQINPNLNYPFPLFNDEVIFHSQVLQYSFVTRMLSTISIDRELYELFETDDLRKTLFFRGGSNSNYHFRGNYTGGFNLMSGLASDEIFLISAEANVRINRESIALERLNNLLEKRYKTGAFEPYDYTEMTNEEALQLILIERRKQLISRSLRWSDLRRLNKDPRFEKSLIRELGNDVYTLSPNSNRYVFPIPQNELEYNQIPQNPR